MRPRALTRTSHQLAAAKPRVYCVALEKWENTMVNLSKRFFINQLNAKIITLFVLMVLVTGCDPKVSRYDDATVGKDPHDTFKIAAQMYAMSETKPFDKTAEGIIKQISREIRRSRLPEDRRVWKYLLRLEPYRQTEEVQQELSAWADKIGEIVQKRTDKTEKLTEKKKNQLWQQTTRQFIRGNVNYKNSRFEEAVSDYRELLIKNSAHLDARNNLALTLMKLNNDFLAQLELTILRRMNEDYLPAMINLTVVYERLEMSDQAWETAKKVYQLRQDIPMAAFNMAWFQERNGDYISSEKILEKLTEIRFTKTPLQKSTKVKGIQNQKYITFHKHTAALAAQKIDSQLSFVQKGLIKHLKISTTWEWIWAIAAFVVATIIAISISVAAGRRGGGKFFVFFLLGGLLYIGTWGLPLEWWWALPAVYILFFGSIAASMGKQ